ncbi:MAG TPA: glycosyltransferase [Bacteroidales bacterium]|nr:glycosyltransferase [Bacteroidales bacterium]
MELSVIIVNYNVRYFLEQCLASVFEALKGIEGEVWVVDNASTDGSVEMVKLKFPGVKLIANDKNLGFSKANNQAIKLAQGKYILLLNPDTVVQENTFRQSISFMEMHPDAGGLTVKMIDGKGHYLPESKRGFPSPWASFCKVFGLTSLFPSSRFFARYYLGHLDKNATQTIEILPGAYMFLRTKALQKAGLLDEQFFMYGEDIDLSYRILQCGYKNYYYPNCQIIHYKGESTKKGSLNYVLVFYKAMILFAQKHFSKQKQKHFVALIKFAVFIRAAASILKRVFIRIWLPLADLALMLVGAHLVIPWWEQLRHGALLIYPRDILTWLIGFYISTWIFSLWFHGAYDKPQSLSSGTKGILYGTVVILVVYSILPFNFRFSRAIIILLAVWATISILLNRLVSAGFIEGLLKPNSREKSVCFIGTAGEFEHSKKLLLHAGISKKNIIHLHPEEVLDEQQNVRETVIADTLKVKNITEIIFGTKGIPMTKIIPTMMQLSQFDVDFKIALYGGESIVGSNSIDTQGELYSLEFMTLAKPVVRRQKRIFDLLTSTLVIILFPILWIALKEPFMVLANAFKVLFGKKTWIGYSSQNTSKQFPTLKPSVFSYGKEGKEITPSASLETYYVRNFSIASETAELIRNIFKKWR